METFVPSTTTDVTLSTEAEAAMTAASMQEVLKEFLAEQQRLSTKLADPTSQAWASLAVLSGVVSALALGKLYSQLSENPEDAGMRILAGRGLTAMIAGVGYVWWELNKAGYRSGGSG